MICQYEGCNNIAYFSDRDGSPKCSAHVDMERASQIYAPEVIKRTTDIIKVIQERRERLEREGKL